MKYYLISSIRTILKVFNLFPIKKNRIMFLSYNGKQYSCNPKYIYEKLIQEDQFGDRLELIWAFNNIDEYKLSPKTKKVKYKGLSYLYYCMTSAIVIENTESWSVLPKRKKQVVINTWHGGGSYKKVGLQRNDASSFNSKNLKHKNSRISLYLSSSNAFSKQTLVDSFNYTGRILNSGMPRNDILINENNEIYNSVKEQLDILNKKVLLIAPTFRLKSDHDFSKIDYDSLLEVISDKFGGEWIILYRSHYYDEIETSKLSTNILDVSKYPDMQELLLVSDMLMTDYSSSMWDFSLRRKPVFLFSTDLHKYQKEERAFYSPVESWPFTFSNSIEELYANINNHENEKYLGDVVNHHIDLGSFENGKASSSVVDFIESKLFIGRNLT